jgi:mycothiol system anti-sigma-R factor
MKGGCEDGSGDCSEMLAEVYLLLDHECPSEHEAELRKHLDGCPDCLEQYGISDQLKQLLARKCGGDHAPDQLKERLRATIRKTRVERGGVRTTEVSVELSEE